MRLWVVLLLCVLCVSVVQAGRTKINKHEQEVVVESSEEAEISHQIKKMKKQQPEKKKPVKASPPEETEESEEEEESQEQQKSPPKKTKHDHKQKNKVKEEEEKEETYEICADDSGCECEDHEIICDEIVFEDDSPLEVLNLAPKDKEFVTYFFNSRGNYFQSLKKGSVLPAMEKTLAELDLSKNMIKNIAAGTFESFKNLTILKLSNNHIQNPKASIFNGAPEERLHQLFLNHNLIKKLEVGVFANLKNLRKLVLDGNRLSSITKETFKGLENLETLSLDDCELNDELPLNVFDNLPKLKALSLRRNKFTEVPRAVDALNNLESIDLSGTHISEVHKKSFKDDHKIKFLLMQDMPYLWSVQDCAFCGLSNLEEIDFSESSHLYNVDENAFGHAKEDDTATSSVKSLNLENCNISTLSENLLEWTDDFELKLSGNAINCTCETEWLLEETYFSFDNSNKIPKCSYPESVKGKPLTAVKQLDVCAKVRERRRGARFIQSLFLLLTCCLLSFVLYYLITSGRLMALFRQAKMPQMSYAHLNTKEDEQHLESDFQPRPQQV